MIGFWTNLAICALCAGLLPSRWGIRVWLAITMPLVTLRMTQPQLEPFGSDLSNFFDMVLALFLAAGLAGVGLRSKFEQRKTIGGTSPTALINHKSEMLRLADEFLGILAGICGGLFLVLGLALAMRGFPGGLMLHLALFAVAAAAAAMALHDLRGPPRSAAVIALSFLAFMALVGGLYWPTLVAKRAAEIQSDLPRCLRAIDRLAKAEDTMLFTLPRGLRKVPGLILTVIYPNGGMRYYRWSYRAMRFVQYGTWSGDYYHLGPCPEN
jgi:hypothetical protein